MKASRNADSGGHLALLLLPWNEPTAVKQTVYVGPTDIGPAQHRRRHPKYMYAIAPIPIND